MHPFYDANARLLAGGRGSQVAGMVSMAAYLAFWAGAVALGVRILNDRFPATRPAPVDAPRDIARARYARGEIDQEAFRAICAELDRDAQKGGPA